MIAAGVIGATGYAGVELVRLLLRHPQVAAIHLSSVSFEGQQLEDIYQNLFGLCDSTDGRICGKTTGFLATAEEVVAASDVVFTALPHGVAEAHADECLRRGKRLIDLSADFRFGDDEATFRDWYKKDWDFPAVHAESVYGLPEMYREKIRGASIVGNPGCYVTSATLGLLPSLKKGLIATDTIIVDSKSGVTGAGRNPSMTNQFCECGESVTAYGVGGHRHQPEIKRNCTIAAGKECGIVFTPHLLPMSRGIISTMYAPLSPGRAGKISADEIRGLYKDFYGKEPFVRVLDAGRNPTTRNVRGSNYCDVQVYVVDGGRMLQVISVLDNMVKGASGQAVQNMNLICGFAETAGLDMIPAAF